MITLAIETSCDETAVCLLETRTATEENNEIGATAIEYRILANLIHSQIALHRQYGGVFPIMAKREHARILVPLIESALAQAKIQLSIKLSPADHEKKVNEIIKILQEKESDFLKNLLASPLSKEKFPANSRTIDRIAVTRGPGLEPALWVGVNAARALGILWDIPVVGVNHMEGHVVGSLLPSSALSADFKKLIPLAFPALALLISGGHTELVLIKKSAKKGEKAERYAYEILGRTKDDAVGEAFDKVARLLGLPYPGGPEISRLAEAERNKEAKHKENTKQTIILPRPMIHSPDLDFSFSGLKTSVLYLTRELHKENNTELTDLQKSAIALAFEDAVADVLTTKTEKAIEKYGVAALVVGGGVIANGHIARSLTRLAERHNLPIYMPPEGVSGDNALMIALAGALSDPIHMDVTDGNMTDANILRAEGNLSL